MPRRHDQLFARIANFQALHAAAQRAIEEAKLGLDHHFLNDVPDLGPPTMENLSVWIWHKVSPLCRGLTRVTVYRDSTGETCSYFGKAQQEDEEC